MRYATFGDTELKSGDRVTIATKNGTKGDGVILSFRKNPNDELNICVQMDEGTKYNDSDYFPFRETNYDRIADIGISFDEVKNIEAKARRPWTRRTETEPETVKVTVEKTEKKARVPKKAKEPEPEPEVKEAPKVKAKAKSKPKAKKPKVEKVLSEPEVSATEMSAPAPADEPIAVEAA